MDDMSNAKEMVDDYMERNQEDFDEFSTPDDVYEEILQDLDSLEVSEPCTSPTVHDKCPCAAQGCVTRNLRLLC